MNKFYTGWMYFFDTTNDVEVFVKRMKPFFKFHEFSDPQDVEDAIYENFYEAKANEI